VSLSTAAITLYGYSDTGCTSLVAQGISATSNPVTLSNGVASFSGVKVLKTQVVRIGAAVGSITACSEALTISAGSISQISFTTQPAGSVATNSAFTTQPVLSLRDANGNTISTSTTITLTPYLSSNCSSSLAAGTLSNATATSSTGVVSFTSVSNSAVERIYLKAAAGAASACASTAVTVYQAAATSPPTTNLALWLKADSLTLSNGDAVSTWSDSSGNGNSASQGTSGSRPTYVTNALNGKPVLRFNGSSTHLTMADSASLRPNSMAIIAVFKRNTNSGSWSNLIIRPYFSNSNWVMPYSSWGLGARYGATDEFNWAATISGTINRSSPSTAISSDVFHVVVASQDGTNQLVYSDGTSIFSAALAGNLDNSQTGQNIWIGATPIGEYLSGDVAELIIYGASSGAALSTTDRAAVQCYLNQKYNLRISTCPKLTPFHSTRTAGKSYALSSSGGTTPYTYAITSGDGSIDSNGVYTAPSAAGTTTVQIADANGNTNSATIINLASSIPSIVTSGLTFALDAAYGLGSTFAGIGCSFTTWFDLVTGSAIGTLTNFSSCGASTGWNGDGTTGDPYRLSFDGSNDIVLLPSSSTSGLSIFSTSFWVKTNSTDSHATYWNRPSLFGFASSGTGDFGITTQSGAIGMWSGLNSGGDNSVISSSSINDDIWHHVAVTNDASTIRLYVDGSDTTSSLSSGLPLRSDSNAKFAIGGQYQDWTSTTAFYHSGHIAQFRLYNKALSPSLVARTCNASKAIFSGASCATYSSPTQLSLTPPAVVPLGDCSPAFTITTQDNSGNTVESIGDTIVTPSGLGSNSLYSDPLCATSASTFTISDGSSTASFYVRGDAAGTLSVSVSDQSGTLASSAVKSVSVADADPYWSSVVLLMAMDGASFTESKAGLAVTNSSGVVQVSGPTGYGNTAQFSSTQKGLSVPDSSSWTIGTGSYTVEARVKLGGLPSDGTSYSILSQLWGGVDTNWMFYLTNVGGNYKLGIFHGRYANGNVVNSNYYSDVLTGATAVSTGSWINFAFTYDGTSLRFFKDGVLVGTTTQTSGFGDSGTSMAMMMGSGYGLDYILEGEMDEVRITKGVCRYSTTYTPRSTPFPAHD
jgi:hypothetical protein